MKFTQYFKNLFTAPHKNILSDTYISWWKNILFLIFWNIFMFTLAITIRITLFPEATEDYYQVGPLVEGVLFIFFIYFLLAMIPFSLINIGVMQAITKLQNIKFPSFQKVFSDHTTVFFYVITLSMIGLLWIIYQMIVDQFNNGPFVFFVLAFLIYTIASGFLLSHYLTKGTKKWIPYIYSIALMTIMIGFLLYFIYYT